MYVRASFATMIAASVTGASSALASDLPSSKPAAPAPIFADAGWRFGAEGGVMFSRFSKDALGYTTSPSTKLGTNVASPTGDVGAYGAISLGRSIDANWDWRVSGAYHYFDNNGQRVVKSDPTYVDDVRAGSRFQAGSVDLDIGRTWRNESGHLKLFAGLRGARIADVSSLASTSDKDATRKLGSQEEWSSHITAAGPRIGVEALYNIDAKGTFGLVGGASASALFGSRVAYKQSGDATVKSSKSDHLYNLNGYLGLSMNASKAAAITIGYRAEQWRNARPENYPDEQSARNRDVLAHIPFARLDVKF